MSGPTAGGWSLDGLVMLAVLVALACVWLGAPVLGIGAGIAVLLLPLGERVFRDPAGCLLKLVMLGALAVVVVHWLRGGK